MTHQPRWSGRGLLPCAIGLVAFGMTWVFYSQPRVPSDFSQLWTDARAWYATGTNPYTIPGPWNWNHHFLLYPWTAAVISAPLLLLPIHWANAVFVGSASFTNHVSIVEPVYTASACDTGVCLSGHAKYSPNRPDATKISRPSMPCNG